MSGLLLQRLKDRDSIEKNFSELFNEPLIEQKASSRKAAEDQLAVLKLELESKDKEISDLKSTLKLKSKDTEHLHDEIITLNIENNLLEERLNKTKAEYDEIVQRWLRKVQQEANIMNDTLN
ncbi:LAQU0S04e07272g1_1 [Lachancea quebecensis]|uniref:LAQU0S04e07272g1_1 n=1 Tax=Lachancea quebecensis TaxID=1654605 RepID=A0A0P1KR02_9SACH|nr:LAQU0S04e07272g1_1 [Lachancea quebecensis]